MKVLITGGAGFLGINLIRFLMKRGITDITSLDIAKFNYPEVDKINTIEGDIRDKNLVAQAVAKKDAVIHSAAALPLYKKDDIYSTDVKGTENILESAFNNDVKKFVYISSTAVYGTPKNPPIQEDNRSSGVGYYGKAKVEAEQICEKFRAQGMCVSIIRPKSFIGPERLGVFSLLYDWAKDGKNFPIIGNGNNRYQLLDVDDLCEAINLCLIKDKETVNDTFNIGAKVFTTLKEDFQAVLNEANFGKKIVPFPATPAIFALKILEIAHLSPIYQWVYETASKDSFLNIEKAEKKLGFTPRYSNKEALIRNYNWYVNNHHFFKNELGISHRTIWKQKALKLLKVFF